MRGKSAGLLFASEGLRAHVLGSFSCAKHSDETLRSFVMEYKDESFEGFLDILGEPDR